MARHSPKSHFTNERWNIGFSYNYCVVGEKELVMLEIDSSDLMQKSLDALWLRMNTISNNIANVDTPGYKSEDVEFEDLLTKALNDNNDNKDVPDAKVVKNENTSTNENGNNVDIDSENIELYRTQIQYEYMVKKISDQFSNLKIAITEGKG